MNTLKSAAMVVVCTGICLAVYVHLHRPPVTPQTMTQQELESLGPPEVEEGFSLDAESHDPEALDRRSQPPAADSEPSLYGPSVVSPSLTNANETSPASVDTPPEGRTLAHTQPVTEPPPSVYSPLSASGFPPRPSRTSPPDYDPAATARRLALHEFKRDWEQARQQVDAGEFRAALATLSPHYEQIDLPPQQRADLLAWLDALAAKVIYSREHLVTGPYKVRGTQARMIDIAQEFRVPAQLLQNINAQTVNNPDVLLPGTVLKVVPGPFRAVVDLSQSEVTVYLDDLYAGRFPFARGDEPILPGQYQVQSKRTLPTYVGTDSRTIPGNDPSNPYGMFCLELGSQVRIHGSPLVAQAGQPRGCISLSPKDAEDLYSILLPGSSVVIR